MDFVKEALRTEPTVAQYDEALERLRDRDVLRLLHVGVGLATEAAEILDQLKKHIIYGKPIDSAKIVSDLGDGSWYARLGCAIGGLSVEEMMAKNVAELRVRFPDKFDESKATNRDEAAEARAAASINSSDLCSVCSRRRDFHVGQTLCSPLAVGGDYNRCPSSPTRAHSSKWHVGMRGGYCGQAE